MRYVLLVVMFLVSLILPGTLFYFWSWSGIKPDLVMLLVIYYALHNRMRPAVIWGFSCGIIQDLYLGRHLGMFAVAYSVVALSSNWMAQRWSRDNFLLTVVMVLMGSVAGQFVVAFLSLGAGVQWSWQDLLFLIFGVAVYNAILVPVTYPWVHRSFLQGWLRYRPKYER